MTGTGCLKKTPEFSCNRRIVVTFEPCNRFTNCFFLLKTEIHTQILNTETFLCNLYGAEIFTKQNVVLKQINSKLKLFDLVKSPILFCKFLNLLS